MREVAAAGMVVSDGARDAGRLQPQEKRAGGAGHNVVQSEVVNG